MISLIHPSRGRPDKSFDTIRRWVLKAGISVEVIISLDNDDPYLARYLELYNNLKCTIRIDNNNFAVGAINGGARIAQGEIFIVVSDDQEPTSQWAVRLLKYTHGLTDWVLKARDDIQPKMITQPILHRTYYQRDGYIYHPGYKHLFADQEFTDVAHLRKRVIVKNLRFPHKHYSVLKKPPDEMYLRSNATYHEGKAFYKYRKSIKFGL